jgi:hypothetical protein
MEQFTAFRLANEAGVSCPDNENSPGADFLLNVQEALIEALDNGVGVDLTDESGKLDDIIINVADEAPSIYTHQRFRELIDLAAYGEDLEELGTPERFDLHDTTGACLFIVARRLCYRLVELWAEELALTS